MAKTKVTNISNGPRGAYLGGVLVMAERGETIEADDFAEEWFAADGSADAKAAAGDLSALTKAQLIDLANAESVEIETDDNKADLIGKIEAARK